MMVQQLAPVLMLFSYFHIENPNGSNGKCYCQEFYAFSVIAYVTGLYLLKMNYLYRLNMVLNPSNADKCTRKLLFYIIFVAVICVITNIIQYITIDSIECEPRKNGCTGGFKEWSLV